MTHRCLRGNFSMSQLALFNIHQCYLFHHPRCLHISENHSKNVTDRNNSIFRTFQCRSVFVSICSCTATTPYNWSAWKHQTIQVMMTHSLSQVVFFYRSVVGQRVSFSAFFSRFLGSLFTVTDLFAFFSSCFKLRRMELATNKMHSWNCIL